MIKIITTKTLRKLRAEAALVPRLRSDASEAVQARQGAEAETAAARTTARGAETAAATARRDAETALRAALALIARDPAGTAAPSRRDSIRGHLDHVLADPAPANHLDYLRDADLDRDAAFRQIDQVRVLQLLYGHDEVAAAYRWWLDDALRDQAKTAAPLASWDEVAIDSAPIGWGQRDVHGFLCVCCGEASWQVIQVGHVDDQLCLRCARRFLDLAPGQVWAARLPPAHNHLAYQGLLGEERRPPSLEARLADGSTRRYELGDASAFLVRDTWMDQMELTAAGHLLPGPADQPRMEITGTTRREGYRFSFIVTAVFDPAPQGFGGAPYGFRFTAGILTGPAGASAYTDAFRMLDTIARSEQALTATELTPA